MNLSQHFTLEEMLFSEAAARMGKTVEADDLIVGNLRSLCVDVLEPVRNLIGKPLTILSGYRPLWLNKIVGGSKTSEHMDGRAADFIVSGMTPEQVCVAVKSILFTLPVNQLIFEFDRWTHISLCALGEVPRRQVLTARMVDHKANYIAGIVSTSQVRV